MMLIADTLPSNRGGVTDCRKVVVLITHRIGPAPSKKKLKAASQHGQNFSPTARRVQAGSGVAGKTPC
jgi:hypothetical protein